MPEHSGEYAPVDDRAAMADRAHLNRMVADAYRIMGEAIEEHITKPGKRLAGEVVLYSGGNDSTVLAHLVRRDMDYAAHINTSIGIEATRQFVRDTCAAWDLPLIEEHGESYRDRVIRHGFPGPAQHFTMYQRLKERGLRKVRKRLVQHARRERVVFVTGMRRDESARRARNVQEHHRDGSTVWVAPLANWTNEDMALYRRLVPGVPRNPVSEHLHMSGECLCGAFAKPNELEEIRFFYPETAAEIEALQDEVRAAGHPEHRCKWGWGAETVRQVKNLADAIEQGTLFEHGLGPLCSTCTLWTEDEEALAGGAESGSNRQAGS